jgi:hypothetical protein
MAAQAHALLTAAEYARLPEVIGFRDDVEKRLLVIHTLEADTADVIRTSRLEWPFHADLSEMFARLP